MMPTRTTSSKSSSHGVAVTGSDQGEHMVEIGRNDLCPCGSGKKFKKCHLGRENELSLDGPGDVSVEEMGAKITALRQVEYGQSRAMIDALDLKKLTGREVGVRFLDLKSYAALDFLGGIHREALQGRGGGVFINPYKTSKADPHNLYLAISPDVDESTLVHELAHVLAYLTDQGHVPGTLDAVSFEVGVPVDHLEHPQEFGFWLDYLQKKFDVLLDADDAIIRYLFEHGLLIRCREIQEGNSLILRAKSEQIFRFLSERNEEIDLVVRNLPGYIGPRTPEI